MKFVYSNWYIVLIFLVIAVVCAVVAFFKMDKADRQIIKDFVDQSNKQEQPVEEKSEPAKQTSTESLKE